MDLQQALITRVLAEGDLRPLREFNLLQPEKFTSDLARLSLEYIIEHHRTTGALPSRQLMQQMIPGITFEESQDPLKTLLVHVSEELAESSFRLLQLRLDELLATHGPLAAAEVAAADFLRLSTQYGNSSSVYVAGARPEIEFRSLTEEAETKRSVPIVWVPLQAASGGLSGGWVMVLYARLKRGKTFALLEEAQFLCRCGFRVLYVSNEDPVEQVIRRLYALDCGFPYHRLVGKEKKKAFFAQNPAGLSNRFKILRAVNWYSQKQCFRIYRPRDFEEPPTIQLIERLINQHNPDLLIVDQMAYLEVDKRIRDDNKRLGHICRLLGSLAAKYDLPTLASHQGNRSGVKKTARDDDPDDIYGSDQIAQAADLVFRLRLNKRLRVRHFDPMATREIDMEGWATRAEFCNDLRLLAQDDPLVIASNQEAEANKDTGKKPPVSPQIHRPRPIIKTEGSRWV